MTADEMMVTIYDVPERYPTQLTRVPDGYIVSVVDAPHWTATGRTADEAYANLTEVVKQHIDQESVS